MTAVITSFRDDYAFLSSFGEGAVRWTHPDMDRELLWHTREHAFQAAKTTQLSEIRFIYYATKPGEAKRLGQEVTLRVGWDHLRKLVMHEIVLAYFQQHEDMAARLIRTAPALLIEGNPWGDDYWGAVPIMRCRQLNAKHWTADLAGHNYLGRILMSVRDLLQPDSSGAV
jgi:N-glycosidase YbiA